jgi:hypothetical protein
MLPVDTDAECAHRVASTVADWHDDRSTHSGLPRTGLNVSRLIEPDVAGGDDFVAFNSHPRHPWPIGTLATISQPAARH